MAGEEKLRLFWAIDLDEPSRRALASWSGGVARRFDGWWFLASGGLHLTLRFLGDSAPRLVPELLGRAAAALAGTPRWSMTLGGWDVLPDRRRPRVLVVEVREGADHATRVAGLLEEVAVALGYAPELRPFRPHLTVARVRRHVRRPAVPADAPAPPERVVEVGEAVLYRSHLEPGGARYERLGAVPFGSGRCVS